MLTRTMKLAFALSLALVLCGGTLAYGADWQWRGDRDDSYYGQRDRDDSRFYQQGLRDGQDDRAHNRAPRMRNRGWDDESDRQAYTAGYRAGYGQGGYYGNGAWGNGGWQRGNG